MIEIRTKHEAYSSKILERTYHSEQITRNSDLRTINLNKASHIIAYCVNNEIQKCNLLYNVKNIR